MGNEGLATLATEAIAVDAIWILPVGAFVQRTGLIRPILLVAVPTYLLGGLLMILGPACGHSFILLTIAQGLMATAHSIFETVRQVALLSGTEAADLGTLLALLNMSERLGKMMGSTAAHVVWATVLPNPPKTYLTVDITLFPEKTHPLLEKHLSYEDGSADKTSIVHAYDRVQLVMFAAGCIAMLFAWGYIQTMRAVDVREKGRKVAGR